MERERERERVRVGVGVRVRVRVRVRGLRIEDIEDSGDSERWGRWEG